MARPLFTVLWTCFAVGLLWPTPAQAHKILDLPNEIAIIGTIGKDAFQRTFEIMAKSNLSNVSFSTTDLTEKDGEALIGSASVEIQPPSIASLIRDQSANVVVTVKNPTRTGEYRGLLKIRYTAESARFESVPVVVSVRTKPRLILSTPSKIVVKAPKTTGPISRNFTLHEADGQSSVNGMVIVRQDLVSEDQAATLSRDLLQITFSQSLSKGSYEAGTLVIQSLAGVVAGKYSGKLIAHSANADDIEIPVEVFAKDGLPWPFIVLVVGIGLGSLLNYWETKGSKEAELKRRIHEVVRVLNDDADLRRIFGGAIRGFIEAAEGRIARGRLSEAEEQIKKAEEKVEEWRFKGADYLERIGDIRETIAKKIEGREDAFRHHRYVVSIREELEQIQSRVGEYASLAALDEAIKNKKERLAKFDDLVADLRTLEKDFEKMMGETGAGWAPEVRAQVDHVTRRVRDIRTDEEVQEARRALDSAREAFEKAVRELVPTTVQEALESGVVEWTKPGALRTLLHAHGWGGDLAAAVADILTTGRRRTVAAAVGAPQEPEGVPIVAVRPLGLKLGFLSVFVPWVLFGLAAAAGLATLYGTNETFGATKWYGDYLSLFGWGFGVELTRSKLTEILKK